MLTILDTPQKPATGSLTERKSEFIGQACHVEDQEAAMAFVQKVRVQHPKARHVCHCAIWGPEGRTSERMSDDGEPSGTAGKPILEVMRRQGVTDCVLTVTRYFGGILLGSGGLIRAYSSAASLALKAAKQARVLQTQRFTITVDYPEYDPLRRLIRTSGGQVETEDFTDQVRLTYDLEPAAVPAFHGRLDDLLQGRAQPSALGEGRRLIPLSGNQASSAAGQAHAARRRSSAM